MSRRMAKYGTAVATYAIIVSLFVFSWLTLDVRFPTNEYVSDKLTRLLVPEEPYKGLATSVSRFLWEHRALDLTGQAFVIVTAVICCLALLKPEEGTS